jgi:hypothetical protein
MNHWTKLSIEYANQRSYLDDLFRVYPTIPEGIRDIDEKLWSRVEKNFNQENKLDLVKSLLKLDLFPIKDSYIAYLKRDPSSLDRNPATIDRISGRLFEMGLDKIWEKCSEPKETNRQIGPMFRNWLKKGTLGLTPVPMMEFVANNKNSILDAGDAEMMQFAQSIGYTRDKGLDFVGRFNGKYVIGEAKFLTDFGGHQNAQFADAISTIETKGVDAISIAILDGVLFIQGKNKMYKSITETYSHHTILSALVLREFLYSI